jgi:hypothetical protein
VVLPYGLTLHMHSTAACLTTLIPKGIIQTCYMQRALAGVGHMQLRLAQWQRTSTKTYWDENA